MKFYRHFEEIKMTRFMMAALLLAVSVLPARAAGTYDATVGARYIDLDFKGNRGQVQEYDGKLYKGAHGDASVSNQGSQGLFDLSVKDIGSTEENAYLNLDYKSFLKMSAKWENMHHRQNFSPAGMTLDGVYTINPFVLFPNMERNQDFMIRRTETELKVGLFDPANNARFVTGQYWSVEKAGTTAAKHTGNGPAGALTTTNTPFVDPAAVDNTKTDLTLGLGTNLKEDGAISLDVVRSEYKDDSTEAANSIGGVIVTGGRTDIIKPNTGNQEMTGAEALFHFDASKDLALTGAFTGRQRENLSTQYKMNAAVAALNAAYMASQKLTLTARLYARMVEIDENNSYIFTPNQNLLAGGSRTPRPGQGNQLDKTTVRAEMIANFRPVEKVHLKASYKFELNHRRDAPNMRYPIETTAPLIDRYYFDGTKMSAGNYNNDVAKEDTKHTLKLSGKVELPLGMEVEGGYQRMQATRAAFVNQPNWQDDMNATITAALPLDVMFTLMGGYVRERNTRSNLSQYNAQRNTYRTGLDWAGSRKGSVGVDASYDKNRTRFNGWLGNGATTPAGGLTSSYAERGMLTSQRDTSLGAHGKVNLPKGVVVSANGSYVWSVVQVPTSVNNTPSVWHTINDYAPSEVRIARGTVGLEYTPEKLKSLTARASYSIDDWVDKTDSANSGRASIAQLGASMKF
ncbi:MAG: hypothetical protein PHS14_03030 [Elusimicrobia bacterium]|nr:hypothetical protein [Elusimicrobiota bacterium]